jgi:hypothetical protein
VELYDKLDVDDIRKPRDIIHIQILENDTSFGELYKLVYICPHAFMTKGYLLVEAHFIQSQARQETQAGLHLGSL